MRDIKPVSIDLEFRSGEDVAYEIFLKYVVTPIDNLFAVGVFYYLVRR